MPDQKQKISRLETLIERADKAISNPKARHDLKETAEQEMRGTEVMIRAWEATPAGKPFYRPTIPNDRSQPKADMPHRQHRADSGLSLRVRTLFNISSEADFQVANSIHHSKRGQSRLWLSRKRRLAYCKMQLRKPL